LLSLIAGQPKRVGVAIDSSLRRCTFRLNSRSQFLHDACIEEQAAQLFGGDADFWLKTIGSHVGE
jgi:hypothetical protein